MGMICSSHGDKNAYTTLFRKCRWGYNATMGIRKSGHEYVKSTELAHEQVQRRSFCEHWVL
jgi:hypothetical protein